MPTPEPYDDPLDPNQQLEIDVLRQNTTAFILANPVSIEIIRDSWTPDGAGGKKRSVNPPSSIPQVVRLVPSSFGNTTSNTHQDEGQVVTRAYTMLGEWNADIHKGDEFLLRGLRYRVENIQDPEGYPAKYEFVGEVVSIAQGSI